MADNIVGSLFGVDTTALQRQQQAREFAQDYQAVQLDPMQQSKLAILQGTRAFGRGVGGLLGIEFNSSGVNFDKKFVIFAFITLFKKSVLDILYKSKSNCR